MKVRDLLTDESKWTKGQLAKDKEGWRCAPDYKDAVCWCLYGAIYKCYPKANERLSVDSLVGEQLGMEATIWNDHFDRTFRDVRDLVIKLNI